MYDRFDDLPLLEEPSAPLSTDFVTESDDLNGDRMRLVMAQFIKVARKPVIRFPEISGFFEEFKQSTVLRSIMNNPRDERLKACLKNYVATRMNHELQQFVQYFLDFVTAQISTRAENVAYDRVKFTVQVKWSKTMPARKITKFSMLNKRLQLREECNRKTELPRVSALQGSLVPNYRLRLSNELINSIPNIMNDLHMTIHEGAQRNNCEIDDYIKTKITYK